ncbi:MAG: lipid-A-disaccharide synthase, partial [Hyphomicrobiaceae bacterium]
MSLEPRRDHAARLYLVAGEHSGDALGGRLMAAIRKAMPRPVRFEGIGGPHMEAEGLSSLFPMSEVAVMGPVAIIKALPRLVRRINEAAAAGIAMRPDAVVVIDSPELTHPIARRIRKRLVDTPIIDYVSPSVWAWRPGRAPRMRSYIDHVLALLPFEPEVHARLGGPPCTYVGHPLIERLPAIAAADAQALRARLGLDPERKLLVVLPGSRRSEVERLMQPFGAALALAEA